MPLTIRQATPADAPVVIEFNRRLAEESEGVTLDPAVLAAGVAAVLADPVKGPYFLAEEGGEALGQMGVTTEFSDWRNGWLWWIQSVYVRADARRAGVFRGLYEHLVAAARQDPAVIGLRLYVERENTRAQQTYLSLGMSDASYYLFDLYPLPGRESHFR